MLITRKRFYSLLAAIQKRCFYCPKAVLKLSPELSVMAAVTILSTGHFYKHTDSADGCHESLIWGWRCAPFEGNNVAAETGVTVRLSEGMNAGWRVEAKR